MDRADRRDIAGSIFAASFFSCSLVNPLILFLFRDLGLYSVQYSPYNSVGINNQPVGRLVFPLPGTLPVRAMSEGEEHSRSLAVPAKRLWQ